MNLNFPNILTKLFCFDRSKLILLFLFFLWNCDSGCVSADSIGSSDVSAVDVDANPAEYVTTIVGTSTSTRVIVPDISYDYLADYSKGSEKICHSIWSKMNLTYNASYNYSIAYTGSVESCSTAPSAPSSAKLILTADMINGVDMSDEDDETKISSFNAAFSTSTSYNFSTASFRG